MSTPAAAFYRVTHKGITATSYLTAAQALAHKRAGRVVEPVIA